MQALLSLDDAPPISAPFRFFLTAPLFGILAGAMLQLLPVVAGANMAQPLRVAIWVHAAITSGGLFLAAAFLTGRGGGRIKTLNMKKVLSEQAIDRQMKAHFLACGLLVLAACWPAGFVYPAGIALVVANI